MVTVDYATVSGGTATPGSDYLLTSGTLTFGAGELSKTFTVPVLNDGADEPNETVNLELSNPSGGATLGTPFTAVLTITDDDVPGVISFSAAAYSVAENGGTARIVINRTGGAEGITVDFAISDGSAVATDDYTATGLVGTLTFAANELSKTILIPIVDDAAREGNETFLVTLSNPTGGATLGTTRQAVVTIVDNDAGPTVQFSAAAYSIAENAAGSVINVTITRTGSTVAGQTVMFNATPGTAVNGTDFNAVNNHLVVFGTGQASVMVPVAIVDNANVVGNRTVNLTLSNPTAGLNLGVPRTAVLTILEDDATFQFSSATASVVEGASVTLTVTRIGGSVGTATVPYTTVNGTATSPADFTGKTGSLVFGPGVMSQVITIATINDTLIEGNETFSVVLSAPSPAASNSLGAITTATVTITDNDAAGSLQFSSSAYAVNEGGTVTLTVTRTGGSAGSVSVPYTLSDGGGGGTPATGGALLTTAGTDYVNTGGTLVFGNGVTSRTITVATKADTTLEGAETFTVTLGTPVGGATLGAPAAAVVTIADAQTPKLQFSAASYTVSESAGSVTLTVQRVGPTTTENTVQYTLAGSGANPATGGGVDFVSTGGTLTFAVGQSSRTIVVSIIPDEINEPTETFTATLVNPTGGAVLGTPSVATVSITDNDPAGTVQFSQLSYAVVEGGTATITVTRTGTSGPVTVNFATSDGTATDPDDYSGASGTLTFQPGETTKTFTIATATDALTQGSESVVLTLTGPTGGMTLGNPSVATLWILDRQQSVQFDKASASVIEGGAINVVVTRSGVPEGIVAVDYQLDGGTTATLSTDFTLTPGVGTLTFLPGVTSRTITIQTINDTSVEGQELIVLTLANPTLSGQPGGTVSLGATTTSTITLIDNERPDLTVTSLTGPAQAATGAPMTVVVTVQNLAGGPAPATSARIFLSQAASAPGAGTPIGLVPIPALAGGASATVAASIAVPPIASFPGFTPGDYFFSAVANNPAVVTEETTANNGLTAADQVEIVSYK
jgi:hypothetical protein